MNQYTFTFNKSGTLHFKPKLAFSDELRILDELRKIAQFLTENEAGISTACNITQKTTYTCELHVTFKKKINGDIRES